jgi:23S rRNA (guanosine2251-2'-O)-methyltransferase
MFKLNSNNSIFESLQCDRVYKLYISETFANDKIIKLAKEKGIPIVTLGRNEFIKKFGVKNQGCIAEAKEYKTYSLEHLINGCKNQKNPIIVMLDELSDPHNLGAILRSCDVFGVSGVVYKKHNNVSLNSTVATTSAGAIGYVKCCEVTNLSQSIEKLKKNGFWIVGLAGESTSDLKSIPKDCPLVVVVGSEGYGISRLVRKNCDFMAKIPMQGHVSCLNASVSCAIVLYELKTCR